MEKINEPQVKAPVGVTPDQVQMDCPVCDLTHILFRGLDYDEDPSGIWRCVEAGAFVDTYECDCGVLLSCAFTLALTALPAPTAAPEPEPR